MTLQLVGKYNTCAINPGFFKCRRVITHLGKHTQQNADTLRVGVLSPPQNRGTTVSGPVRPQNGAKELGSTTWT